MTVDTPSAHRAPPEILAFLHACIQQDMALARAASGATVIGVPGDWKPSPGGDEWEALESAEGDEELLVALHPGVARPPDVMTGNWGQVLAGPTRYDECDPSVMPYFRHMARHCPARVLRDCAFKRAVLAEHAPVDDGSGLLTVCRVCSRDNGWDRPVEPFPCRTVRILAWAYEFRPAFRPEWRVDV